MIVLTSTYMLNMGEIDKVRMTTRLLESLGLFPGDAVKVGQKTFYVDKAFGADVESLKNTTNVDNILFIGCPPESMGALRELKRGQAPALIRATTVGCDPEVYLVNERGSLIDASSVLPFIGRLGNDGMLAELRPAPDTSVAAVVRNLQGLMRSLGRFGRPFASSFAFGMPCGFHVHLGIPTALSHYVSTNTGEFFRSAAKTLDFLVGLPSMLRDPDNKRRNHPSGYGSPGDFRVTNHTFEYRTAGGYNLHHPWLTRSLMDHCHLFFSDLLSRAMLHTKGWTQISNFNTYEHFSEAYGLPDYKVVRNAMVNNDRSAAEKLSLVSSDRLKTIHGVDETSRSFRVLFDGRELLKGNTLDNWEVTHRSRDEEKNAIVGLRAEDRKAAAF